MRHPQPADIVADAVRTERKTAWFYRMLAEMTSDEKTTETLLGIAEDEERHASTLTDLYADMTGLGITDDGLVKAEGDPNIFDFTEATPRDAMEFALKNEHKAITMYQSQADAADDPQSVAVFRMLAENEREHAAYLELQISRLEEPSEPPSG